MNWIRILLYILKLIAKGLTQRNAILQAIEFFHVSIKDIIRHL